jgi:uncharacterized protein (TIGR03000 family)
VQRLPWLVAGIATIVVATSLRAQDASPVLIYVTVPADTKLAVDGVATTQTGPERRLITPPIRFGEKGTYTLTATFTKDGKAVSVERQITVEGGKVTRVDLTQETPKAVASKSAEPKKIDLGPSPKVDQPKKEEPKVTPKKEEPKVTPKKEEPKVEPKIEPKKVVKLDVPYVATPNKVVEEMLKLAAVKEGDVVYDLGCGDGRIVISAVKNFKAKRGVGVELAPERVKLSKENADKAGIADKVEIREGDVLKLTDLSDANVVTLYLLPDVNEKLRPMLRKTLKPGARVVSHDFDMGEEWKPEKEITVKDEDGRTHTIFLWTIKERPPKLDDTPPGAKKEDFKPSPKKEEAKPTPKKEEPTVRVPYVPTPHAVVAEMLKLAGVKEGDVVYDLGCGDGRIVISAVKDFKAKKGVGVDIDPERIKDSNQNAKDAKVEDKVEFRQGDVLKIEDVSEANVVCLYLFPEVNERLQPMLQRTLKPGSRVVSHDFLMKPDWKPEKEVSVKDADGQEHTLYLWTIKEAKK